MNNDKLVLKDGTEITLVSSLGMGGLYVNAKDHTAACALWKKFSKANLQEVTVKNADGVAVGSYKDMVLDHVEGRDNDDGTVQMMFSLRSKTVEEVLTERVAALEAGQLTQDSAIDDLGQAVSDIAEGSAE